jgi:DNA-directed RNA polymerase subunit H (RpoH/RPB5)
MHKLQPKHTKLKKEEFEKLVNELNISMVQLPKISKDDAAIPKDCSVGDVVLIERMIDDKIEKYYRVVS